MTIRWTGPFNDTALPAGQRIAGWSEFTTGAGTFKTRYRDGDPASAVQWRELYGDVNYQYAQSRRTIWVDQFTAKAAGSVDPVKVNNNATWGAMDSVYCVTPPLILSPNAMRGDLAAPRLQVKVRARRSAGAANVYVRVYAAPSLAQLDAWPDYADAAPSTQRVDWTLTSNTYPADPGWSSEETITLPGFSESTYPFPLSAGAVVLDDITVMETVIIVAGIGDGAGNGPLIAAIQVREESPGA